MIGKHDPYASPHAHAAAFTLTEIVLALAIIATAFVAILGLLPAGLDASRQAANSTVIATVFAEVHQRLQNQPLVTGKLPFSPAFFDERGTFIPPEADELAQARRLYRADVEIGEWNERPVHTNSLAPVTIALSWPVNPATGEAIGKDNPRTVVAFPTTTLTGPDRPEIDRHYVPKIEF